MSALAQLPENAGLAFLGESAWPAAMITDQQAEKLIIARNACGRPNTDVLRRRVAVVRHQPVESWQIDFPPHFTAQEAALYEQPFAQLDASSWQNPRANPELRRALARVSRYLASPIDSPEPDWQWIEEDLLPDASLLVVARDDDFTHGVLQSSLFGLWFHQHRPVTAPLDLVGSFPFPWPPGTALSALSKIQEEQRHAIARAARSGDPDRLDTAVLAAYGWPADDEPQLLERLVALHRQRTH